VTPEDEILASATHGCLKDGTAQCLNLDGNYTCACTPGCSTQASGPDSTLSKPTNPNSQHLPTVFCSAIVRDSLVSLGWCVPTEGPPRSARYEGDGRTVCATELVWSSCAELATSSDGP
jgi:hypothetical protein